MLNWDRDPIQDLERIARSYHLVAQERIEVLKATRGLYPGNEFQAYPIVFMYRQAFELSLKAIVFAGGVLLRDEGEVPISVKELMKHDLKPLFKEVSRIFNTWAAGDPEVWNFDEPELRTQSDFEQIVREFDAVDPGSYTFRYSVKKDGTTHSLEEGFEFDLFKFAEIMDRILPLLIVRPECLREVMQGRWQAAYEAQQEEWANADYDPGDYDPDPY
ncbi:MAG TPA: hypothetical protein VEW48_23805 [Thermoanaerobaculia bacterium]|nr:hypothetical protein [Thermoanaerobaculia bacterium]